jgi:hypothetical protein
MEYDDDILLAVIWGFSPEKLDAVAKAIRTHQPQDDPGRIEDVLLAMRKFWSNWAPSVPCAPWSRWAGTPAIPHSPLYLRR